MLFDEPLSNLDARLRRSDARGDPRAAAAPGLTVAYMTHDQSEALAVSDQIVVMDTGRIAQPARRSSCTNTRTASSSPASWARRCCSMRRRWPDGLVHLGPLAVAPADPLRPREGGGAAWQAWPVAAGAGPRPARHGA